MRLQKENTRGYNKDYNNSPRSKETYINET